TDGFTVPGWTALVLAGYATSIWLLSVAIRQIPVSVAYAVWAGLGTAGIAVVGLLFLHESLNPVKAGALALIIAGVVVLNLQTAHGPSTRRVGACARLKRTSRRLCACTSADSARSVGLGRLHLVDRLHRWEVLEVGQRGARPTDEGEGRLRA